MSQVLIPNCWSTSVKQSIENNFESHLKSWMKRWFTMTNPGLTWEWNTKLFGSIETSNCETGKLAWLNAARMALAGTKDTDIGTHLLERFSTRMREELYEEANISQTEHACQIAANVYIDLGLGAPLQCSIAARFLPRSKPQNTTSAVDKATVNHIVQQQKLKLTSKVNTAPISLEQLRSLKIGQHLMLEQPC